MLQIYGIKNCDSVKKALKYFKEQNIEFNFTDFKENPQDCDKISEWVNKSDINTLFNNRSTTYRNLKLKELNLDNDGKKEYLCKENLLIKRPIIEFNETVIVGFNLENYKNIFS